jgi:hypothetical protein
MWPYTGAVSATYPMLRRAAKASRTTSCPATVIRPADGEI